MEFLVTTLLYVTGGPTGPNANNIIPLSKGKTDGRTKLDKKYMI